MMHRVPSCRSSAARRAATALLLILLLAALGATAAGPAAAAPTEPTLTVAELRDMIDADADGKVPGYFKTVIKGKDIIEIPCDITAVVDGLLWDNTPLIMFEATGPDMDRIGGIAAGMSGSPVFIDEGGAPADDDLVGAVSYGFSFTTGGLGLATPIEYMSAIETDHMSSFAPLDRLLNSARTSKETVALGQPVKTRAAGAIEQIVVASSVKQAKAMQVGAGTAVATPLIAVQIGGLSPNSAAAKHLAAKFERRGIDVYFAGGIGAYEDFETPLVGGAAVGAVYAYGDYWIGGMGTVTYAHDNVVVAFGHPMDGYGETSLIMTNAYVHGVWSSSYDPQKIMTLGKIRGEITQDRSHGIAGELGPCPAVVTMTASATLPPSGSASAETLVPRNMPDLGWIVGDVAWGNGAMPVNALLDGSPPDISANTSLTVVVNDGTHDLTLSRDNLADGLWGIGDDAWIVLDALLSNPNGTIDAELISVDMTSALVLETKMATVLDLEVPGGLRVGDNTVIATVRPYGQTGTETREATLTIPDGTPLRGWIEIMGGTWWDGWWWSDSSSSCCATQRAAGSDTRGIKPLPTLAEMVADIQDWPQNNHLLVTFTPFDDRAGPGGSVETTPIETRALTPQVLYGYVGKDTSRVTMRAFPRLVDRGRRTMLQGFIDVRAGGDAGTVRIYRVVPGAAPDTLLANLPVMQDGRGLQFSYRTPRVKRATTFLAVWSGNDDYIGDTGSCKVRVR